MYDPVAELKHHTLANELSVHHVYWDRPWVKLEAVVHVGSREDTQGKSGLAHYLEHLVSDNSPGHSVASMKRIFESCGGSVHLGSTSYFGTRYGFAVSADKPMLRKSLNAFGGMLIKGKLKRGIDRELQVVEREFNKTYPFRERLDWKLLCRKSLHAGHRLEQWGCPLGTPAQFKTITEEDLQGFYDKYYVPANISLVVVGGIGEQALISALEKSPFAAVKVGVRNRTPAPLIEIPAPCEQRFEVRLSDYMKVKLDHAEYEMLWAIPSNFPWHARAVFTDMLRMILFKELREKRTLSYSTSTKTRSFQDVLEFSISGMVPPSAVSSIEKLVSDCITMVAGDRKLFERKLNARIKSCAMTDTSGGALADNAASDLSLMQRIETGQETLEGFKKVTFAQMEEVARLLSPERRFTFLTLP